MLLEVLRLVLLRQRTTGRLMIIQIRGGPAGRSRTRRGMRRTRQIALMAIHHRSGLLTSLIYRLTAQVILYARVAVKTPIVITLRYIVQRLILRRSVQVRPVIRDTRVKSRIMLPALCRR